MSKAKKYKVEKPAVVSRPLVPAAHNIKPTVVEDVTLYGDSVRYGKPGTPINLLKAVENLGDNPVDQISIVATCTCDDNYKGGFRIYLNKEKANPLYAPAQANYEAAMKKYEQAMKVWDEQEHNEEVKHRRQLYTDFSAYAKLQGKAKPNKLEKTKLAMLKKTIGVARAKLGIKATLAQMELA